MTTLHADRTELTHAAAEVDQYFDAQTSGRINLCPAQSRLVRTNPAIHTSVIVANSRALIWGESD